MAKTPTPEERHRFASTRAQQGGFTAIRSLARFGVDPVLAADYGRPPGFGTAVEAIAEIAETHHLLTLASAHRRDWPPTLPERFAWRHAGPLGRCWLSSCATDYGWPPTAELPPPGRGGAAESAAVRELEVLRRAGAAALDSGRRALFPVPLRPLRTLHAVAAAGMAEVYRLARRGLPLPAEGSGFAHLDAEPPGPWARIEAITDTCHRLHAPADLPPGLRGPLAALSLRYAAREARSAAGGEWLSAARSRKDASRPEF
ncbi:MULTISPECIES: hypothetical protein [Kitasatospora]|uniref:Uncharacterized protein n=1 Tax=Kitasatospora setae (strain ATCC 33774 / DSM 43861 / JCM 3304 / KCC A-0304 / NBRC 14216 / KM-6054) TaxID=452652 RepID=E4N8K9_KITSK|nr:MULTISPECIES: hypothetical protein [Kitasatospora]BAJ27540.1 hypothetical protein KSE_17160 [Kitasatospora setae KM-6054]